jgi:hypothetical protein
LAEKDKALMENIEVMLREQLRQLIQDRVSIEELQQPIDNINNNLDKAEKLFAAAYDVTIIQPGIEYSFGINWFYIYYFFFHKILKKLPYRIKKKFLAVS